jgi:hypothetical protein
MKTTEKPCQNTDDARGRPARYFQWSESNQKIHKVVDNFKHFIPPYRKFFPSERVNCTPTLRHIAGVQCCKHDAFPIVKVCIGKGRKKEDLGKKKKIFFFGEQHAEWV